jgi:PIN domain nuclease of toxin-antitoxin system
MRFLLDSNILVPLTRGEIDRLDDRIGLLLEAERNDFFVSTASLWEIAIKARLGKLVLSLPLRELADYCRDLSYTIMNVDEHHAVAELINQPQTRDPFDRILLAQCQVEGLRLVTVDRVLSGHPLAWQL